MQVAIASETVLPRDRIVNVLHFDNPLGMPSDPDKLCRDLAAIYDTQMAPAVGRHEYDVRLYDEDVPGPPLGKAILNVGVATPINQPREVALCLSFYAGRNTPRTRGRIYLPPQLMATNALGLRPDAARIDKAIALAHAFSALGGADIDWGVYSQTTKQFNRVTNVWVDDEWDTVRSRGLRAANRKTAAVTG